MVKQSKKQIRGIFCALIGGICWGFSGTCGQFLFSRKGFDPVDLTVLRLLLSGVILLLISFIKNRKSFTGIWTQPKDICRTAAFGILGLAVCQLTYLYAISYSNSGTATVLQYLGIVLIMAVICIKQRRLPYVNEATALIMALLGTFFLATHMSFTSLSISPQALLWGLLAALGLMLYTLIPGELISKWGSPTVCGWGMVFGGCVLFLITGGWNIRIAPDIETILGLAAIVIIGTVLAFTLFMQGVSDAGPVKASMVACVEPVAATIFAAVFLNTEFKIIDIIGFALVIGAVLILSAKKK